MLAVTGDWLTHALKKHSTLVEKNIDALSGLLQLNKAERALLLYGTLARYQRDLRSILVEFKVNNAPEAYAAIAEIAGVNATEVGEALARRLAAGAHRPGGEPDLRAQHHRPGRPDEGQRKTAAGADARVPRPERADGGVHAAVGQERAGAARLQLRRGGRAGAVLAAAQRRGAQGAGRQRAAVRAARHRQDRAGQGGGAGRRAGPVRGGIRRPRRQFAVAAATATARCRSPRCSSRAARRPRCCSTRSRTCSRRSPARPRS